jgi:hypothetical protein
MTTTQRTVYLIAEQQRNALLNYLQDRPYREVAGGIQLLLNAPTAKIDVEMPDSPLAGISSAETAEIRDTADANSVD